MTFSSWLMETPWGLTRNAVRVRASGSTLIIVTIMIREVIGLTARHAPMLNALTVVAVTFMVTVIPWLLSRRESRPEISRVEDLRVTISSLAIAGVVIVSYAFLPAQEVWAWLGLALVLVITVLLPGIKTKK